MDTTSETVGFCRMGTSEEHYVLWRSCQYCDWDNVSVVTLAKMSHKCRNIKVYLSFYLVNCYSRLNITCPGHLMWWKAKKLYFANKSVKEIGFGIHCSRSTCNVICNVCTVQFGLLEFLQKQFLDFSNDQFCFYRMRKLETKFLFPWTNFIETFKMNFVPPLIPNTSVQWLARGRGAATLNSAYEMSLSCVKPTLQAGFAICINLQSEVGS